MSKTCFRFGLFEVDLASAELKKAGSRIRLQEQPFQILAALLERPGEVVAREDLIARLWSDGTHVDFERGLNAAVTRLRQALSDSADAPRYVETVARRGYRFIAHIEETRAETVAQPPSPDPGRKRVTLPVLAIALGAVTIVLGAGSWWLSRTPGGQSQTTLDVIPLTTGSGMERDVSFSPDGSQIVYEWLQEDGQRHLWMKTVGAGDPVALTSGDFGEFGPAWSPDGRLIAFLRQIDASTMHVVVKPPLGGVERKVADIATPPYWVMRQFQRRLDWTRDSSHLIVSAPEQPGGGEGLLLISIDDGEKRWLTPPFAGTLNLSGDREPAVSPDGRAVAFARGELSSNNAIYILPLAADLRAAGTPVLLPSAGRARSPAWTPDGKEIVYTTIAPGMALASGLFTVSLTPGAAPRSFPELGRNAALPAVARTGRLAFSRTALTASIMRQEIPRPSAKTAPPVNITNSSAVDMNAQYSPDGNRIAFGSNRSGARELWTCASDGSHCIQVTHFNGSFVTGSPRWSPDGRYLAFDSAAAGHEDIYVVEANGGSPRRLTDDATHGIIPSWSRDGKWIYFSSALTGRNEIWKTPSDSGQPVQITRNGGRVAFESRNGKDLYYTKTDTNATLFRSSLDGSGETEVLKGVARNGFVIAAGRIYYLHEYPDYSASIRQFTLATRADSQFVRIPPTIFLGLDMSPDGKYLIYTRMREAGNLMLVEHFR